jgi:hypothetical protein
MRCGLILLALLVLTPQPIEAQRQKRPLVAFDADQPDERGSTRILYWNEQTNTAVGELAINYGRPVWKKEYEDAAKFDGMTKGKVWRMGNNFWTVLDTNLPISIGGKKIAAGLWYLGLHRSSDGATWSLAVIDPEKARAAHVDPFEIERARVEFTIPMKTSAGSDSKELLTIILKHNQENPKEAVLQISWGKLALTATIEVTTG